MRVLKAYPGPLSALALAALTIFVFSRNQMNGPEGALLRFFTAVQQRNVDAASEAVAGENGLLLGYLFTATRRDIEIGAHFLVLEVQRDGPEASALVQIVYPRHAERTVWFLQRVGNRWYVNARKTLTMQGLGLLNL